MYSDDHNRNMDESIELIWEMFSWQSMIGHIQSFPVRGHRVI